MPIFRLLLGAAVPPPLLPLLLLSLPQAASVSAPTSAAAASPIPRARRKTISLRAVRVRRPVSGDTVDRR